MTHCCEEEQGTAVTGDIAVKKHKEQPLPVIAVKETCRL